MTTDISREELLAHMGYVRDNVQALERAVVSVTEGTAANTVAIARLQEQIAATATARRERRTTADAFVVALLGTLGAGLIEWVKAHLLTGAAAK